MNFKEIWIVLQKLFQKCYSWQILQRKTQLGIESEMNEWMFFLKRVQLLLASLKYV